MTASPIVVETRVKVEDQALAKLSPEQLAAYLAGVEQAIAASQSHVAAYLSVMLANILARTESRGTTR